MELEEGVHRFAWVLLAMTALSHRTEPRGLVQASESRCGNPPGGCGQPYPSAMGSAPQLAAATLQGGNLVLVEWSDPGGGTDPPTYIAPLHAHHSEDEAWYVLEGTLRFRLGDQDASAPAGSFVFVPRGTPHCFQNAGDQPARILVLFTPSGMETFFDAFAQLPAFDPGAFGTLGAEAGMTVVGPPLR
jgi:mannose-6-phosphate isomerase-like protein (cupin superfamily)